jgi:hypothetical protein
MDGRKLSTLGAWLSATTAVALACLVASGPASSTPASANIQAPEITLFPVTFVFFTATPTRTPTPINVGNLVWTDLDADGRQDAGEPGLGGVTLQLWNSTKTALIASTVTNANGNYTLVAPTPGNYRVRALLPNVADQFSPKNQAGGDDLLDSDINTGGTSYGFTDVYAFADNLISITSIDIGIIKYFTPTPTRTPTPINIGNFIWADDGDGVQEAGEPGLANVTVQLWNATKTQLIDSKVTNANGFYTVVAPVSGDYRVRVLLGIGASFAPKDVGGDNQDDSDCNPDGVNAGFTDAFNIASNVISTVIYDCGLLGPYATATPTPPATNTPTPTPTSTPTMQPSPTPPDVIPEHENYLPAVIR